MRKEIRNRFWRIILCAALALMFWFFDLTWPAVFFGAMFLLPVVIGLVLLLCNPDVTKRGGAYQPTVDNTTTPPRYTDVIKCDHEWINHYRSNTKHCKKCDENSRI